MAIPHWMARSGLCAVLCDIFAQVSCCYYSSGATTRVRGGVGYVPLTLLQLADVAQVFYSWMWSFYQINPKQLQVSVHDGHNFNAY